MLIFHLFFMSALCIVPFIILLSLLYISYSIRGCPLSLKEYIPGGWITVITVFAIVFIGFLFLPF